MRFIILAALLLMPLAAAAQQPPVPAGFWRCVLNSPHVSIDLEVRVSPDASLMARGTYILLGTNAFHRIEGPGRVSLMPPDASNPNYGYRFQVVPGVVPVFSMFLYPTGDPNSLYDRFTNPQTGGVMETACQRTG